LAIWPEIQSTPKGGGSRESLLLQNILEKGRGDIVAVGGVGEAPAATGGEYVDGR